jgi:ATP synthase protein I
MAEKDGSHWGGFLTAGLEVAVGIALGWLVGSFVDRKLGSAPWGLLIGILVGCAAGMYLLIKEAIKMNKD